MYCRDCKTHKQGRGFSPSALVHKSGKPRLTSATCIECMRTRNELWYANNLERKRERSRIQIAERRKSKTVEGRIEKHAEYFAALGLKATQ